MNESAITTEEKTTEKPSAFTSRSVKSNGRERSAQVEVEQLGRREASSANTLNPR